MILNYANLAFDKDGLPETPVLMLQTLSGTTVGVISGAFNIELDINFVELSELSFDVPAVLDGVRNPIYDSISGHMIVYTERYGVYLIDTMEVESDGIEEVAHISASSIEKELSAKKFFLEEGTYKFCNLVDTTDTNTLIGRILEKAVGWSIGFVATSVAQKYRTFDEYDDYLLDFFYDDAPDKYRCIFVFEPYNKKIYVYDVDATLDTIPIYLDFNNLLTSVEVEEQTDELVTAISPYGADELDIREVNPIGTNWIYDISYFVSKGDVPKELSEKYTQWQKDIASRQSYYEGLSALRASTTARLLAEQAVLTDLNGELDSLKGQQNVAIQLVAMDSTQQSVLDNINTQITVKQTEIDKQESAVKDVEAAEQSYADRIAEVVAELSISKYFTDEEYGVLQHYFIEQYLTEETFVATDIDTSVDGSIYSLDNNGIEISGAAISKVEISDFGKTMYSIAGGSFAVTETNGGIQAVLGGDIIRGTIEIGSDSNYTMSVYTGSLYGNNIDTSSGMITASGTIKNLMSNITDKTVDGVTTQEGSYVSFSSMNASLYITADVSDYQRYSVKRELYDFALETLDDVSSPTYEFSVDSGNFLFEQTFSPFRNNLELGKGVYLNLGNGEVITPYIIEMRFEFEDRSAFELLFSNRFKRNDPVNTLRDMLESSYSTSRSIDATKYVYNQAVDQLTSVGQFMSDALDAALNTVIGAGNQSVIIDSSGINIYETDTTTGLPTGAQLRIVNGMIAMSEDDWQSVRLAIGRFETENGSYYGVNADVVAGKLLVGNELIIESAATDSNGSSLFKVDKDGVTIKVKDPDNDTYVDLDVALDGISSTVTNLEGDTNTKIEQLRNSLTLSAGSLDGGKVSIKLTAGDKETSSSIDLSGLVTFSDLSSSGKTTIDGSNITTGIIKDSTGTNYWNLDTGEFSNTGLVKFTDLSTSGSTTINGDNITTGTINANYVDLKGALKTYTNAGALSGTLGYLAGSTEAGKTDGIGFRDATEASEIKATNAGVIMSYNDYYVNAFGGSVVINAGNCRVGLTDSTDSFSPSQSNSGKISLGSSGILWSTVYASSSSIVTSDRNLKHDIEYNDLGKYESLFTKLKPCRFKYNDGTSGRYHVGFISQDVGDALSEVGLTSQDFGGYVIGLDEETNEEMYYLRYDEFVAINTMMIQRLTTRVNKLETALKELKES